MGVRPDWLKQPAPTPHWRRATPKRKVAVKFNPHAGQQRLLTNAKRFNKVNCGRRFGKTTLGEFILIDTALTTGKPVAWFAPNYKDLSEVWKLVKKALLTAGLIADKNEQIKQIVLVNGAVIDFWSLSDPDSGRGRKYALIIVDEVAKIKNFLKAWKETLRSTLVDYAGKAWFFSTPKGRNNDWYKFCNENPKGHAYFEAKSSDNPGNDPQELADAKAELPTEIWQQEFEAKFVDMTEGLWANYYDDKFVLRGEEQIEIDPEWPLYITFDFNIDPTTALLFQVYEEQHGGIFFIDELQVKGGTELLCENLQVYKDHPGMLYVTGDHSGNSGSTAAGILEGGEYNTDYQIIKDKMDINDYQLVDTRTPNKRHILSRGLINWAFKNELIYVNERCDQLVSDLSTAVPTASGKLLKDRNFFKNDALDAFRYGVHTQCALGVESLKALKMIAG